GRYLAWLDEHAGDPPGGDPPGFGGGGTDGGADSGAVLRDMAWTAGVGRTHFEHRAGIVFDDAESLREGLEALDAAGRTLERGRAARVAFAYTGQGSQWRGMGRALYESEPVAREVMDHCEAVFRQERGTSLLDVMFGRDAAGGDLGDTAWEQPALYTLESALTALWASVGIRPDVVLGHSVGEIAAAQAAGVFSLEDGMRFACTRGALMSGMEDGAMAAFFAPAAEVAAAVAAWNATSGDVGVSISGDNGAHQVVSGPAEGIEAISKRFEADGIRVRRLNTAKAFHSALVDPILDALGASLDGVAIAPPSLTLISNLDGRAVEGGRLLDGAYWRRHAREAVAFSSGVGTVADCGVDLLIEIGPRPVLAPMALTAWPASADAPAVLSSLHAPSSRDEAPDDASDFVRAVAEAYEAGLPVRFEGLFAGESRRRIGVPGYPFQRTRHWLDAPRRRRGPAGHPLLGTRHESAGGETTFETEVFPTDPPWLDDHRVYRRVVVPGALYGAMAASASRASGSGPVVVEEMQLHSALVFPEDAGDDGTGDAGRTLQMVLETPNGAATRDFRIFSKGSEGEWVLHVEGRLASGTAMPEGGGRTDLSALKARLSPVDVAEYYRARLDSGVELGPRFQTLTRAWAGPGEAVGEVALPEGVGRNDLDVHPLVLDGCFQVVGAARNLAGPHGSVTYLPFGWERLWLRTGELPDRVVCHVRLSDASRAAEAVEGEPPEVITGELRIHDLNGALLGGLDGYTVKRATRAALLSAGEGVKDLLYEVVWRERALPEGMPSAGFFPDPGPVKAGAQLLAEYLIEAGVDPDDRNALLADLEHWSWAYAVATLDTLGWRRSAGEVVRSEALREQLGVKAEHGRLFRRMLEMAARAGVLSEDEDGGFRVSVGSGDPWPDGVPRDPGTYHEAMAERYSHGLTEIGLFRRSAAALPEVLHGREDPLTLLFSSGEPTAADLYLKAPVARAANRMREVAVQALVDAVPEGRRLRVIEVGAGTGSATASVLPILPEGRFDYMYTDISAGFFAEAEARFGDSGGCIEYRPLDIEKDPVPQGFDAHGYDLIIASNVLHATRYLEETLDHCRKLLAPSGQLVALENLSGLGWMDLTFGQLDGWWRFADDYRPHHALASPAVWRRALGDAGFGEVEVVGVDESDRSRVPDKGVIVARGPAEVREPAGGWVLAADRGGVAAELAGRLAARNQIVVLAGSPGSNGASPDAAADGIRGAA
ncbi:MAG: acyltransferase domain-containing protein, partial [Gemmatimonadetes bacterium]|nr:acyltransferase domain-containing protein [Gemmatimonadota bacterium]